MYMDDFKFGIGSLLDFTTTFTTTFIMSIVFALLKCGGVIEWSWWWIFTPLYVFVGIALVLIIAGIISMFFLSDDFEDGGIV